MHRWRFPASGLTHRTTVSSSAHGLRPQIRKYFRSLRHGSRLRVRESPAADEDHDQGRAGQIPQGCGYYHRERQLHETLSHHRTDQVPRHNQLTFTPKPRF